MKLTGKIRYRASWLGKMILQVQLANVAGSWRDARISDLDFGDVRKDLIGEQQLTWDGHGPIPRKCVPMPQVKSPRSE